MHGMSDKLIKTTDRPRFSVAVKCVVCFFVYLLASLFISLRVCPMSFGRMAFFCVRLVTDLFWAPRKSNHLELKQMKRQLQRFKLYASLRQHLSPSALCGQRVCCKGNLFSKGKRMGHTLCH